MQPAGNFYDKYHTKNPLARWLMTGFLDSFDTLLQRVGGCATALEAGCGEGELTIRAAQCTGARIRAFDISPNVVAEAERRIAAAELSNRVDLRTDSIYELVPERDSADLVICCEVLEHLDEPNVAIDKLASVCGQYLIASVPREPLWRILNMARGKYWRDFGNTPGHYQHWSSGAFVALLERRFEIVELRRPLPWTMALCRPRR
ncbi:methyltransferase domain-containing protein [Luteimonas sp. RD2P54]|uniref:Methyltransferase domain-containing protein n=1 Tax=Luteimonas endophytica TaxID=3042023 RepID=A0ABT6J8P9_9GAMM|nr:methyltransferase domain-containing protein [Luteimonas endophytica]MDH5822982.1 methyltransferase domain-containing protein [Luteimonas endophytica]